VTNARRGQQIQLGPVPDIATPVRRRLVDALRHLINKSGRTSLTEIGRRCARSAAASAFRRGHAAQSYPAPATLRRSSWLVRRRRVTMANSFRVCVKCSRRSMMNKQLAQSPVRRPAARVEEALPVRSGEHIAQLLMRSTPEQATSSIASRSFVRSNYSPLVLLATGGWLVTPGPAKRRSSLKQWPAHCLNESMWWPTSCLSVKPMPMQTASCPQ
jgi:hypothetical protein